MTACLVVVADQRTVAPDQSHLKLQKGMPVTVVAGRAPTGSQEGLPDFLHVLVSDAVMADLEPYCQPWEPDIQYQILSHDAATDTYQVRMTQARTANSNQPNVGRGRITRSMVENFLAGWGATVDAVATNQVDFTVTMFSAMTSRLFWDGYPKAILDQGTFTEVSYDDTTGVHRIAFDYSGVAISPKNIERATRKLATVVDHDSDVITLDIARATVFQRFKEEVAERLAGAIYLRRYYVPDAVVDDVVSQGGRITITMAQFLNNIRDRLTD